MTWSSLPTFHQIRDALEVVYFLSTVALAVIAAYGLQQIRVLKQDIKIRNERAAKEQAIAISERFIKSAEYSNAYQNELTRLGIRVYEGQVGDFTRASLSKEALAAAARKWPLQKLWLSALNELEAMSAGYISGVADEQLGYAILGIGFCVSAQKKYDMMCLHRTDGGPKTNYWKNTIALYKIWSERAKKEGLLKQFGDIADQLRSTSDETITPIGL